jgi:retron-type reverse transcriptase
MQGVKPSGHKSTRIGQKARKEPYLVFTSLYHHGVDVDNLRTCYDTLKANKATGVDGITKEQYGENLVQNLQDLSQRLKDMGYRPQPKKYVHHIVEADIRSFFHKVNHQWMIKILAHRIGDPHIMRLIGRMVKAGVMEGGLVRASEEGRSRGRPQSTRHLYLFAA